MTYRVILQSEAKEDLRQSATYIRQHAPQAAERWLKGFLTEVQTLGTRPEQWPLAPESESLGQELREWHCRTKSSVSRAVFIIVDDEVRVRLVRPVTEPQPI